MRYVLEGSVRKTGDTVSIISLIGLILLMGLVTKNAILLVDYTKVLRHRGMDRRTALITAGRTRLRPNGSAGGHNGLRSVEAALAKAQRQVEP